MKIGIIYSTSDPAGSGIAEHLRKIMPNKTSEGKDYFDGKILLRGFDKSVLEFDFLDEVINVDFYVILSKHKGSKQVPSLTVHHTGNPNSSADYGGQPYTLSWSNPLFAGIVLKKIWNKTKKELPNTKEIDITYEVTHHGPTNLKKPLTFVEIGSTIEMWTNTMYQKIIAESVYETIVMYIDGSIKNEECEKAVGYGGGHYANRFTKITLTKNVCFGHILSKHALRGEINEDVILQSLTKNYGGINSIWMEKKAARKDIRDLIKRFSKELNLELNII